MGKSPQSTQDRWESCRFVLRRVADMVLVVANWKRSEEPMGPATRRKYDLAQLMEQPVEWTSMTGPFPWRATVNGQVWEIGIAMDEKRFRLMIDGVEAGRFLKWPATWGEPVIGFTAQQKWLHLHRHEYPGEWVALDGDRLIGHGKDFKSLMRQADAEGVQFPFVEYVQENPLPSI